MKTTAATADAATATPVPAAGSCKVLGWKVFAPGYHKGKYYSAANCRQVVENFERLSTGESPYLKPKAKLGHDDKQLVSMSLGFPSCGTITGCRLTPDNGFEIDIEGVPLWIGAEINAGRINDGSVEFPPDLSDPDDPSKKIPGPVLSGIAFLGEEQPAVKGNPPPKAILDDGTPVAMHEKPEPWLAALMGVKGGDGTNLSQGYIELRGKKVFVNRIRFSEVTPVNRDQLLAALADMGIDASDPAIANLPDEALAAIVNQSKGDSFAAAMKKKFAASPDMAGAAGQTDPDLKAQMSECVKKMGALEGAVTGIQDQLKKTQPDLQASVAFSQDYHARRVADKKSRVNREVDEAIAKGKILPVDKDLHVSHLMGQDDVAKFSDGKIVESPFDVAVAAMHARPVSNMFRETINDAAPDNTGYADRIIQRIPGGRQLLANK